MGISLKWDYKNRTLDTSVPGFVSNKLNQFQHSPPSKPQHAPAKATPIQYGAKVQRATPSDTSAPLPKEGIRRIQEIVGSFAWYARATDPTMAKTLSTIAGRQAKATEALQDEVKQLMDYCHTHPDAAVRFVASDMLLALHSDGSHLSKLGSKSRAAGHFYLTNRDGKDMDNSVILTLSKIIKLVMGSAS